MVVVGILGGEVLVRTKLQVPLELILIQLVVVMLKLDQLQYLLNIVFIIRGGYPNNYQQFIIIGKWLI